MSDMVVMLDIADHEVKTSRKAIVPKEKLSLVYNADGLCTCDDGSDHSFTRLRPNQFTAMKHSVDVSVSLAEGEARLMRIKRACEEHGNQVGNGVRLDATRLRDPSAAFLMMVH